MAALLMRIGIFVSVRRVPRGDRVCI